jgi:hypothetical protein
MQLSFFKPQDHIAFLNYRADAERIIQHTKSAFNLKESDIVLRIINDHAIWFYNPADGDNPVVSFWSARSRTIRTDLKLSEFMHKHLHFQAASLHVNQ